MAYNDFFPIKKYFFRTKIQAQRKFAQGQNPPSSAYLTYNLTSGNETPQREKSPERELLPNLRPNTEDFLTFLCFRGTSSLPKELDFTNSLNQPSTSGASSSSKAPPDKRKLDKNDTGKKKSVNAKKSEASAVSAPTPEKAKEIKPPLVAEKEPKRPYMPFAVRKRAEMHPVKNDKKKVQANATKKNKQQKDHKSEESFVNDNSSSGPRATRSTPVEEKATQNNHHDDSKTKAAKRKSQNVEESSRDASTTSAANIKNIKLDKSPRIELTPIEKVPIDVLKKDSKLNNSVKKKPLSKKEREKQEEEEKRQTRLSALKNPTSTPKNNDLKNGKQSPELEKYFSSSSDDDEPLVKTEPKSKKHKVQSSSKVDVDKATTTMINKNNNSVNTTATTNKTLNDTQQSKAGKGRGRKKKVVASPVEKEKEKSIEKSIAVEKQMDESTTIDEQHNSAENKKVGRKKKSLIETERANSQANTTDLSENETRGRPMRKTKEAATIYMELIGRKLTLQDSSDNDSSLDSLEVPNLKRVELLENELKANVEKGKAEKKKAEEKKVREHEHDF